MCVFGRGVAEDMDDVDDDAAAEDFECLAARSGAFPPLPRHTFLPLPRHIFLPLPRHIFLPWTALLEEAAEDLDFRSKFTDTSTIYRKL